MADLNIPLSQMEEVKYDANELFETKKTAQKKTTEFRLSNNKRYELEGEEGIVLKSGRFHNAITPCLHWCCCNCCVNVERRASANLYWIFTKPTPGLLRRDLDAATLHEEIDRLNMLSLNLYGSLQRRLRRFMFIFGCMLVAIFALAVWLFITSYKPHITILGVEVFLSNSDQISIRILSSITFALFVLGICVATCMVKTCTYKRTNEAKKKLINHVTYTLNQKYNQSYISWGFVEEWINDDTANIAVKCISMPKRDPTVDLEVEIVQRNRFNGEPDL